MERRRQQRGGAIAAVPCAACGEPVELDRRRMTRAETGLEIECLACGEVRAVRHADASRRRAVEWEALPVAVDEPEPRRRRWALRRS